MPLDFVNGPGQNRQRTLGAKLADILRTLILTTVLMLLGTTTTVAEPNRDVASVTNQYRAQFGLPALQVSPSLERVAELHSRDMTRNRFFSHQGSDGSDIGDRARRGGYRYCVIAENIAQGHRSAIEVARGWMKSPGHRANMLDRSVTEIGVTRGKGNTWVMVLGSKDC